MKFAIVLLLTLGLIALSHCAPALEENALAADTDSAAMNDLADPNCSPQETDSNASTDGETASSQKKEKKEKKEKKGKKGKKGKGKNKDTETPAAE